MFSSRRTTAMTAGALLAMALAPHVRSQVIFEEDWEAGLGEWEVSAGEWEVGFPTDGPDGPYRGEACAGTNLSGNYSSDADSRLISPWIELPKIQKGEELTLHFWHWIEIHTTNPWFDQLRFEVFLADTGEWQRTQSISEVSGCGWTRNSVQIGYFAGQKLRLGFRILSDAMDEESGWFIDDLELLRHRHQFHNPETFEGGMGDYTSRYGLWQIGIPTHGPTSVPSGVACAATSLDADYCPGSYGRLLSPYITLTPLDGQEPVLHLDHWFRLAPGDEAIIVVWSLDNRDAFASAFFHGTSSGPDGWQHDTLDLHRFFGDRILVEFIFGARSEIVDAGWYIDNVQITGIKGRQGVTFSEFGRGLEGSGDFVPHLSGEEEGWHRTNLVIDRTLGGACAFLWAGVQRGEFPFKGGSFYIDLGETHLSLPFVASGPRGNPGAGRFELRRLDVSAFAGLSITTQATVFDPGAPHGIALSNGLDLYVNAW